MFIMPITSELESTTSRSALFSVTALTTKLNSPLLEPPPINPEPLPTTSPADNEAISNEPPLVVIVLFKISVSPSDCDISKENVDA